MASGDESAEAACKANGQTPVNEAAANAVDSSSVNNPSSPVPTVFYTDPSNQEQPQSKPVAPKLR